MGNFFSTFNADKIDGLGLKYTVRPRPTPASTRWVEHLLLASAETYYYSSLPAVLCAAYFLGIAHGPMLQLYEQLVLNETHWPEEDAVADSIGVTSLAEHMGEQQFALRYFEFFRDELTDEPEWQDVTHKFLPDTMCRMFLGDCGPLRALAAAVEINVPILAMYALGWACSTPVGSSDFKLVEFAADAAEDAEMHSTPGDGILLLEAYDAAKAANAHPNDSENLKAASDVVARTVASSIRVDMPHELISEMITIVTRMVESPASSMQIQAIQAVAEIVLASTAVCTPAERNLALRLLTYRIVQADFLQKGAHKHTLSDQVEEPNTDELFTIEKIAEAPLVRAKLWAELFQRDRDISCI